MTIATIFRRFDLRLINTIRERDVDVTRDCFLSEPMPGSRGVKIQVLRKRL